MKSKPAGLEKFKRLHARLKCLTDQDPAKAVEEARALSFDRPIDGPLFAGLKASILIDAGDCIKDKQAVAEGVELLRKLMERRPEQADLHYNLGNGLAALAQREPKTGYDWYLTTADVRCEARSHFQQAISLDRDRKVVSVGLTNLGNAFSGAYRWAEAYDSYVRALGHDTTNHVASTGAVRILLRCIARGIGNKQTLLSVAAGYLQSARQHPQRIVELAGTRAYNELAKLLQRPLTGGRQPDLSRASDYERFVATNRLALSPTIEGLDPSLKRWDSLRIGSITEPAKAGCGVPPLFAMFNVMKSDFLATRYLAYQALTGTFPDSGLYSDTLDYAVYGVVPSMLSLAQRACVDILDKIAVATSEYFAIPDSEKVNFIDRWFERNKGQPRAWHPSLRPCIDAGNTAIVALAELSLDVQKGGALYQKKAYRHASTHRFTVLHDVGCNPSRESVHVKHCAVNDFKSHLIESLQLARAAVLYFVEMVSINEAGKRAGSQKTVSLYVPSHHEIRGEDERMPRAALHRRR